MKYLTVKNYNDIESAQNAVINRVNEAQKRDRFNNYGTERFLIFDKDLAEEIKAKDGLRFVESYNCGNIPKNKSANATIIDAWSCEFYYDARDGRNGITEGCHFHLVSYKGMLFNYSFFYSKTAAVFFLFNDSTVYDKVPKSESPNRMGTITDKGMEAWYQYLIGRKKLADSLNNSADKKWADLVEKIKKLAEGMNVPFDEDYRLKNKCVISDNDVDIRINGIRAKFHYNSTSGYISKEMSLCTYYFGGDFLDIFAKLADNGFGK